VEQRSVEQAWVVPAQEPAQEAAQGPAQEAAQGPAQELVPERVPEPGLV